MQTWRDLAGELELALRVVLMRPVPALFALLAASAVYAVGTVQGKTALGTLAIDAGLVGLLFAVAALMRAYAPFVPLTVIEPRRGYLYLVWAAVCVSWPIFVYTIVDQLVLRMVPLVPTHTARAIALISLLPLAPLFTLASWAFADVVVSAVPAPGAILRVLGALRSPAVVLRTVVVTVLFAGTSWVLWTGLQRLIVPFPAKELARGIAFTVADLAVYALLSAVLLTTLPAAAAPARKRPIREGTITPKAQQPARSASQSRRRR